MSGQGDQLTIDPTTFYAHLNRTVGELNILDELKERDFVARNENEGTNETGWENDIYELANNVLKLAYVKR